MLRIEVPAPITQVSNRAPAEIWEVTAHTASTTTGVAREFFEAIFKAKHQLESAYERFL